MFTPKITAYDTKIIPAMYQDGWIMITIYDDKIFWHKDIKQKKESRELDLTGFELWYKLYPRKKNPGDAKKAWNKLSENERTLCVEGIKKYIIYWKKKGITKEFMPYPATWLCKENESWNDDLSEVPETAIIQTNDKAREEDNEERKNREEKEALDKKIEQYKRNPEKWKQINEQALSELSDSQKQSTMKDILLQIKIRMIISNNY